MGSSPKRSLSKARATHGWMVDVPHEFIFSDQHGPDAHQVTLPQIQGKPTYVDAQQRQSQGLKWLWRTHFRIHDFNWFMLVDDDTRVNVGALSEFVQKYSPTFPMALGHILHRRGRSSTDWFNGGAGVLFTRAAVEAIVENLHSPVCPCRYGTPNDLYITSCCKPLGVLRVHTEKFSKDIIGTERRCLAQEISPEICLDPYALAHHRVPWETSSTMHLLLTNVTKYRLSPWNCSA